MKLEEKSSKGKRMSEQNFTEICQIVVETFQSGPKCWTDMVVPRAETVTLLKMHRVLDSHKYLIPKIFVLDVPTAAAAPCWGMRRK